MKKITRVWLLIILVVADIAAKINCLYLAEHCGVVFTPYKAERIVYILNAAVILVVLSLVTDYVKKLSARLTAGVIASLVFIVQLLAENYYLLYYSYNCFFDWEDPAPYPVFVTSGLELYFNELKPGFHWAFLAMLAVCIAPVVWKSTREKRRRFIARLFLKKAVKGNVLPLSSFERMLTRFSDCYSREEFVMLRMLYIDLLKEEYADTLESAETSLDGIYSRTFGEALTEE